MSKPTTELLTTERETDAELVVRLRRLVDEQEGGDAVVLVQRQLFNRVVGRLASRTSPATEAVAYIQPEALAELAKHKDATATVCSGLLKRPFGNPIPLYATPQPVAVKVKEAIEGYLAATAHVTGIERERRALIKSQAALSSGDAS